jgi:hypothetical protein
MVNYNYLLKYPEKRDNRLRELRIKKKNLKKLVDALKNELYYNTLNNELLDNQIDYCKEEIDLWNRSLNNVIKEIDIIININKTISRITSIKSDLLQNCYRIVLHPNCIDRLTRTGELTFGGKSFLSHWGWDD